VTDDELIRFIAKEEVSPDEARLLCRLQSSGYIAPADELAESIKAHSDRPDLREEAMKKASVYIQGVPEITEP
jgi:hypothetical protein